MAQMHTKYIRTKTRESYRIKYALTHTERKQLIRECGPNSTLLFEYYLRMASVESVDLTDKEAAEYFDWSPATAKRHRLKLVRNGWYAVETASMKKNKIKVHYLGKSEVQKAGLAPAQTKQTSAPVSDSLPEGPVVEFFIPGQEDE